MQVKLNKTQARFTDVETAYVKYEASIILEQQNFHFLFSMHYDRLLLCCISSLSNWPDDFLYEWGMFVLEGIALLFCHDSPQFIYTIYFNCQFRIKRHGYCHDYIIG